PSPPPALQAPPPPVDGDEPRLELDAVALGQVAWARADQRVARAELASKTRLHRRVEDASLGQPPEEVAPEHALGQRLLARGDREHDLMRRRQLLCDLEAGVAAADHEHGPLRNLARSPVADGVRLE